MCQFVFQEYCHSPVPTKISQDVKSWQYTVPSVLMGNLSKTLMDGLEEELLMHLCKHRDNSSYIIKSILFKCTFHNAEKVRLSLKRDTAWLDTQSLLFSLQTVKHGWILSHLPYSENQKLLWLSNSSTKIILWQQWQDNAGKAKVLS